MGIKSLASIVTVLLFGCCTHDPYFWMMKNAPPRQERSAPILGMHKVDLEHPVENTYRLQEKIREYANKNNIKIFSVYRDDSVAAVNIGDRCGYYPTDEQISKYISGLPAEIIKESPIRRKKKQYTSFGMSIAPITE